MPFYRRTVLLREYPLTDNQENMMTAELEPDPKALEEVKKVHEKLDPPDMPLITTEYIKVPD